MNWLLVAVAAGALASWWGLGPPPLARLASSGRFGDGVDWGTKLRRWLASLGRSKPIPWRGIALACDLLGVGLASGLPLRLAVREVVLVLPDDVAAPLRRTLCEVDLGVDEEAAWRVLSAEPGWGPVARDVARSVRSGMALSGLLSDHAKRARAHAHTQELVRARQAGVRGVMPLVVCFLPAFMLLGVVPLFGAFVGELWS